MWGGKGWRVLQHEGEGVRERKVGRKEDVGLKTQLRCLARFSTLFLSCPRQRLLQGCVEHVAASLLHYLHTRVLGENEAVLFRSAVKAMADVVVPYLASCFTRVFPGAHRLCVLLMRVCPSAQCTVPTTAAVASK